MEICDMETHCLLSLNLPTITEDNVCTISKLLKNTSKPVIIDMAEVNMCVNNFFRLFRKHPDITLLNTDSKILATLFMTGFDKYVKIYGESVSLEDNSRELKNRRFCVV